MNEKKIKEMWAKSEKISERYDSDAIRHLIQQGSVSVPSRIRLILQIDMVVKLLVAGSLALNILFYSGTPAVYLLCLGGIVLIFLLLLYERYTLKYFNRISDPGQPSKEIISRSLSFLKTRFKTTVLSVASTQLFFFTTGILSYFYYVYGQVRPLDSKDLMVLSIFYIIGLLLSYTITTSQVSFYRKHLELCLSDLNENTLAMQGLKIASKRKQDIWIRLLLGGLIILGFLLLIFILKNTGF